MGYCSTIIIGEGTELKDKAGTYFQEIARFNLGKVNIDHSPYFLISDFYIYNNNSDKPFNRDSYGEKLTVASIKDATIWLKATKNEYLIAMAKALNTIAKQLENPQVLHFGY